MRVSGGTQQTIRSSSKSKLAANGSSQKRSGTKISSSGTRIANKKSVNKSIDVDIEQQRKVVRDSYLKGGIMPGPDRFGNNSSAMGSYNYKDMMNNFQTLEPSKSMMNYGGNYLPNQDLKRNMRLMKQQKN